MSSSYGDLQELRFDGLSFSHSNCLFESQCRDADAMGGKVEGWGVMRVVVQSFCWVRRRGGTKLTLGAFSQIPLGKKNQG